MNRKILYRLSLAIIAFGSCMFIHQAYRLAKVEDSLALDNSDYRIRTEGENRLYRQSTHEGLELHLDGPYREDLKVQLVFHGDD